MSNEIISTRSYPAKYIDKHKEIDRELSIYELTFNSKIVFKMKEGIISIPLNSIKHYSIIEKSKGFIMKKEDKMILLEYHEPRLGEISILFDVKDDDTNEILTEIERLSSKQDTKNRILKICYMDDSIKEVIIDPWSEYLYDGEENIWFYENNSKWYIITIFRIMIIDDELREVICSLPLQELDDVIVMNTYRNSVYTSTRLYTGYANRFFGGSSNSYSSGKSRTFGDIIFLKDGKPVITFNDIQDPKGLARLIKSIKKQLYLSNIHAMVICKN